MSNPSARPRLLVRLLVRTVAAVAVAAVVAAVVVVVALVAGWRAFGHRSTGARLARLQASPQWRDGHFNNTQPMYIDAASMTAMLSSSPVASPEPSKPVPATMTDLTTLQTPPSSGLRVTWFGHASTLIELDGARVLTDPAFGERASPFDAVGPARWFPPTVDVSALDIDAIVISHDHHDHLQLSSVDLLKDKPVTWFVPLGVGAHLEYWGVDPARIVELDWWQEATLRTKAGGDVVVHCVPARHASGRWLFDQGQTLWASWAFVGDDHRVFFSGDTGLHTQLQQIGDALGPFDLTLIEVGQYHPTWPDWHIGPEQAVKAHQLLRGKRLLPIHWALWTLAPHGWTEPGERVVAAAAAAGVPLALPVPGQPFEPAAAPSTKWWPDEPWQRAEDAPIVSTADGVADHRMP